MAEDTKTEEAKQARIAAEKAQEEKRAAEIEAQQKKVSSSVQETGDAATQGIVGTAKGATTKGAELASDAGNWFTGLLKTGGDHIKGLFKSPSGLGVAGIVGGGFLAWIIGEAFGGGGLFGMILSLMLAIPLAIAGRDFAEGHLAPALQRNAGSSPEKSPEITQGPVPEHARTTTLENPNTQEIAEAARRQADQALRGNTGRFDQSQQASLLPPSTNAPSQIRMRT